MICTTPPKASFAFVRAAKLLCALCCFNNSDTAGVWRMPIVKGMPCEKVIELLSMFRVGDRMDELPRAEIEKHLGICKSCHAIYVRGMTKDTGGG